MVGSSSSREQAWRRQVAATAWGACIDYMKLRATCRIHAAINVTSEAMDRRGWVVEIGVALRCDLLHPSIHA